MGKAYLQWIYFHPNLSWYLRGEKTNICTIVHIGQKRENDRIKYQNKISIVLAI